MASISRAGASFASPAVAFRVLTNGKNHGRRIFKWKKLKYFNIYNQLYSLNFFLYQNILKKSFFKSELKVN